MTGNDVDVDCVVIGAGFGGMYAAHALEKAGFSIRGFEAGNGVGGTWYWNRYPGARCDVESLYYSYTFNPDLIQDWTWSERYATQPEIQAYAQFVADRLGLIQHFTFGTTVHDAVYDENAHLWTVTTGAGEKIRCRFVLAAVGNLSASETPPFPGLESFRGQVLHTGRWPHHAVDLRGQRVGVIGTGSSGTQAIPEIAKEAAQVNVFMRTPNYAIPARNRALTGEERRRRRRFNDEIRARGLAHPAGHDIPIHIQTLLDTPEPTRTAMLEYFWQLGGHQFLFAFNDTMTDMEANAVVSGFVRNKIREIVQDPETVASLTPDYPFGAKRVCLDTDFYETFNLPHVRLVDLKKEPIIEVVAEGIRTDSGVTELDVLVLATGFDAMTGPLTRINIRGTGDVSLADTWQQGGPATYLGISSHGFPNLFMLTGPGSPSVLANVISGIEQHVDWVVRTLTALRDQGLTEIEATEDAQSQWWDHVQQIASQTIYMHGKSWYRGQNIEGKQTGFLVYAGGLVGYRDRCDEVADAGYPGFILTSIGDKAAVFDNDLSPA